MPTVSCLARPSDITVTRQSLSTLSAPPFIYIMFITGIITILPSEATCSDLARSKSTLIQLVALCETLKNSNIRSTLLGTIMPSFAPLTSAVALFMAKDISSYLPSGRYDTDTALDMFCNAITFTVPDSNGSLYHFPVVTLCTATPLMFRYTADMLYAGGVSETLKTGLPGGTWLLSANCAGCA